MEVLAPCSTYLRESNGGRIEGVVWFYLNLDLHSAELTDGAYVIDHIQA